MIKMRSPGVGPRSACLVSSEERRKDDAHDDEADWCRSRDSPGQPGCRQTPAALTSAPGSALTAALSSRPGRGDRDSPDPALRALPPRRPRTRSLSASTPSLPTGAVSCSHPESIPLPGSALWLRRPDPTAEPDSTSGVWLSPTSRPCGTGTFCSAPTFPLTQRAPQDCLGPPNLQWSAACLRVLEASVHVPLRQPRSPRHPRCSCP